MWTKLYSVNQTFIENVKSCINPIRQEFFGFLHEFGDSALLLICFLHDYYSIFGWVLYLSDYHCSLFVVRLMKVDHLLKWELTNDV